MEKKIYKLRNLSKRKKLDKDKKFLIEFLIFKKRNLQKKLKKLNYIYKIISLKKRRFHKFKQLHNLKVSAF
jgi:hypothetical protein